MYQEYLWAIGTTVGGTELQNYTSTGREPTGINTQLEGQLFHKGVYYVSVICINGGRARTVFEDPIGMLC